MNSNKSLYLIIFIIFNSYQVFSQAASWQWAKRGGTTAFSDNITAMTRDKHGNVYLLSDNRGTVNVDGHIYSRSDGQMTLSSWDCNGNYRWMKVFGGKQSGIQISGLQLATDTLEGVYVSGYVTMTKTTDTAYFDSDSVIHGISCSYIIKYNSLGQKQWLKMPQIVTSIGGNNSVNLHKLYVSPNGRVFWYAYLAPGGYDNNSFFITTNGYHIVEFNAMGNYQKKQTLPISFTYPSGIVSCFQRNDINGSFIVAGSFVSSQSGTLSINGVSIQSINNSSPLYLATFDSTGKNIWVKQGSANKMSTNLYLKINKDGNLYFGGNSSTNTVFNGDTLVYSTDTSFKALPFVAALDTTGKLLWQSNPTYKGNVYTTQLALEGLDYSNNTIGIAGYYNDTLEWDGKQLTTTKMAIAFLARLNAATGKLINIDTLNSPKKAYSRAIVADNKSNFYLGCIFDSVLIAPNNMALNAIGTGNSNFDWGIVKFGKNNCNCQIPQPEFYFTNTIGTTYNFQYTGSTPYLYIRWDFGDGTSPVVATTNPSHTFNPNLTKNYPTCVTTVNGCDTNTVCHFIPIVSTTAIKDLIKSKRIKMFPNPSSQEVYFENVIAGTTLSCFNIMGNLVFQKILNGTNEPLKIDNLQQGLYMLRLRDNHGNTQILKLVKE